MVASWSSIISRASSRVNLASCPSARWSSPRGAALGRGGESDRTPVTGDRGRGTPSSPAAGQGEGVPSTCRDASVVVPVGGRCFGGKRRCLVYISRRVSAVVLLLQDGPFHIGTSGMPVRSGSREPPASAIAAFAAEAGVASCFSEHPPRHRRYYPLHRASRSVGRPVSQS